MRTVQQLTTDLARGKTSSATLVAEALARISAPGGEGSRTFVRVSQTALQHAGLSDSLRQLGVVPTPLAGLPVSIKDLFDVAGEQTTAGSKVLRTANAAASDSLVVQRLRSSGAVLIGRSNMTEFAFDATGVNPHYGTPRNPYDRAVGRIPGGSSSGAAVSVSDGMSVIGIGSDTGGSIRIPAALCGLAGFKPTQGRISRQGLMPLSTTLDSIGWIAPTVGCCAMTDAVLSGGVAVFPEAMPIEQLRLGILQSYVLDALDDVVARTFERAISALSRAGCRLSDVAFPELAQQSQVTQQAVIASAEAYAWHRKLVTSRGDEYDQRMRKRVLGGAAVSAADYIELLESRRLLISRAAALWAPFDAIVMPTVPIVAPPISGLERDDQVWEKTNFTLARNTRIVNVIDGCAASVPCHRADEAPVGLMLVGASGNDVPLLQAAMAIERIVAPRHD